MQRLIVEDVEPSPVGKKNKEKIRKFCFSVRKKNKAMQRGVIFDSHIYRFPILL